MLNNIIGWDVGGAHLKAVLLETESQRLTGFQQPCELWKGLDRLTDAVRQILGQINVKVNRHAITMTGELVDLFANRDDGVAQIIAAMQALLPPGRVAIYAGGDGFIEPKAVQPAHYASIASANWLASATWAATKVNNGVFIDIGSTTTDILVLQNAKVNNTGYSDYERLVSQELVYTGVVRTPVMAVAQSVVDQGHTTCLMAEYFATMADVYRLTGELDERHDQTPTADGGEKTVAASAKRLARMIGCDYIPNESARWLLFAGNLRECQLTKIQEACLLRLRAFTRDVPVPVIGAGVGRFLAKSLAANLDLPYIDVNELFVPFVCLGDYHAADCAPSAAIAGLYLELMQG